MNALEVIASNLKDRQEQLTEFLVTGGAKDYAHYQAIIGEIKGLMYATNGTRDMADRLAKENDD